MNSISTPPPAASAARLRAHGRDSIARRHPLLSFVLRRVAGGLLALFIVSMLIFAAVQILPGNVAEVVLGRNATPERLELVEDNLNLDQPLPVRYWEWISGIVTGDLGNSSAALAQGQIVPVSQAVGDPIRNSLILALITIAIFIPMSLILGTISALRRDKWIDKSISSSALALSALPEFLVGTVLLFVFFSWLEVLPAVSSIGDGSTPLAHPDQLVLPILTLLAVSCAFGTRLLRASVAEVLRQDYVAMARLNGFGERRVVWRYVLRNAVAPSVQVVAQMIQYLLGGIIIIEALFNYPGIGSTLVQSVLVRDPQMVSTIALILAAIYIAVNILADLAVVLLSPRLRTEL